MTGQRRAKRRLRRDGYIEIWLPEHPLSRRDGYIFEHRLVAFEAGLLADPTLHIHHVNHDKSDNRLENLAVMTVEEHATHHAAEDGFIANQFGVWPLRPLRLVKRERPCEGCGATIPLSRRADARHCSKHCQINAWKRQARNGKPRLTDSQVAEIRRRISCGEFQRLIAADYGISRATVSSIATGRSWKAVLS